MGLLSCLFGTPASADDPALVYAALVDHYQSRYRRHRVFYLFAALSSLLMGLVLLGILLWKGRDLGFCGFPALGFARVAVFGLLGSSVLALYLVRGAARVYSEHIFANRDWAAGAVAPTAPAAAAAAAAAPAVVTTARTAKGDVEQGGHNADDDDDDDEDDGDGNGGTKKYAGPAQSSRLLPHLYSFLDQIADALSPALATTTSLNALPRALPSAAAVSASVSATVSSAVGSAIASHSAEAGAGATVSAASGGLSVGAGPVLLRQEREARGSTFSAADLNNAHANTDNSRNNRNKNLDFYDGGDDDDDDEFAEHRSLKSSSSGQASSKTALSSLALLSPAAADSSSNSSNSIDNNEGGSSLYLTSSSSLPTSLLSLLCVQCYLFALHVAADAALSLPAIALYATHGHCRLWAPGFAPLWAAAVALLGGTVLLGHVCAWVAALADAAVMVRLARAVAAHRSRAARART